MSEFSTKIVTGKVRFSYAFVFEPQAIEEGATPKYSVSVIIPKSDTAGIEKIQNVIDRQVKAFLTKNNLKKLPAKFHLPLRDGDEERPNDPAYADSLFFTASSLRKPQIVDRDLNPILDKEEFYSGCYGRVSINLYSFDKAGNKGIAVGLNNIQKLADGERLDGGSSAEEDFADSFDDDDALL